MGGRCYPGVYRVIFILVSGARSGPQNLIYPTYFYTIKYRKYQGTVRRTILKKKSLNREKNMKKSDIMRGKKSYTLGEKNLQKN